MSLEYTEGVELARTLGDQVTRKRTVPRGGFRKDADVLASLKGFPRVGSQPNTILFPLVSMVDLLCMIDQIWLRTVFLGVMRNCATSLRV